MAQSDSEDTHLLERVAGGDSAAFAELFDRHGSTVLGLLVRMLGRRSRAEELLQEVFLQVWRTAGSYRTAGASPKGWILLIARSRALDRIRSGEARRRREERAGASDPAFPVAVRPEAPERLEREERRRDLDAALATLPEEQRRPIEHAFFEGLTHGQIAERLGQPLGTVKSRILLGMKKLRTTLRSQP